MPIPRKRPAAISRLARTALQVALTVLLGAALPSFASGAVQTLTPEADAYIAKDQATTNFGSTSNWGETQPTWNSPLAGTAGATPLSKLGKHTLTLKVRNSPTGTPQQDSSDVLVIRNAIQHP